IAADGASVRLALPGGFEIAAMPSRHGFKAGDAVFALIRPERIELSATRPAEGGAIEGRIAKRVFSGDLINCEIEATGGIRLLSTKPSLARFRELALGQTIWGIPVDCRALPKEG